MALLFVVLLYCVQTLFLRWNQKNATVEAMEVSLSHFIYYTVKDITLTPIGYLQMIQ